MKVMVSNVSIQFPNLEQNRNVYMRDDVMTLIANVIFNETRPG